MKKTTVNLNAIAEPADYFQGIGQDPFPSVPSNILVFVRHARQTLQQEALQNRSHHRFVLIFNLHTTGHVHVDHLDFTLAPGQALLVFPYQFHHFTHLESASLQWMICTFELDSHDLVPLLRDQVVTLSPATCRARDRLAEEWILCQNPSPAADIQEQLLRTSVLRTLLRMMSDAQPSHPGASSSTTASLVREVNRILSRTRGRAVRIPDLAQTLHLSESGLRASFRESAGVPLGAYIQNHRLNRAMSLLRTTSRSLADIAGETGFGSPQAFSRAFRRETGVSPRAYRQT